MAADGKPICHHCERPGKVSTRLQYPFAHLCAKCYRLWKRRS